jgi:hypothetical protein
MLILGFHGHEGVPMEPARGVAGGPQEMRATREERRECDLSPLTALVRSDPGMP